MRPVILLILYSLLDLSLAAQPIDMTNRDTVFKYFHVNFQPFEINTNQKRAIGEDPDMFRRVINQQFGSLITGQSKNLLGNFASVDITDPTVAFAANVISKNGSIFSIKATGGVTDGLFSIFSNSKLNTQVSLDLQYNFLSLGKRVLIYNTDTARAYKQKVDKIKYDWEDAFITLFRRREKAVLQQKETKLQATIDSLSKLAKTEADKDKLAKLEYDIETTAHLRDSVHMAVMHYPDYQTLFRNLREKTVQQLQKVSFTSAVAGFSFGWFSIGYKVNNSKFKLFNPAMAPKLQVTDTSFVSHAVNFQYSHYTWTPQAYMSYFYDAGLSFTYADNFSSLTKKEINEVANYGANPGDRTVNSKYNAYTGTYKKDLKGLKFFADVYWFLFKNNIAALHINPEWATLSGEKPVANTYTGFLFSFKSNKTDNTVVNAELYYKFLDIFKTTKTDYLLFERNNIGIRFTFPIQFKQ